MHSVTRAPPQPRGEIHTLRSLQGEKNNNYFLIWSCASHLCGPSHLRHPPGHLLYPIPVNLPALTVNRPRVGACRVSFALLLQGCRHITLASPYISFYANAYASDVKHVLRTRRNARTSRQEQPLMSMRGYTLLLCICAYLRAQNAQNQIRDQAPSLISRGDPFHPHIHCKKVSDRAPVCLLPKEHNHFCRSCAWRFNATCIIPPDLN